MLFYNSETLCSSLIYISSFTWWINQFFSQAKSYCSVSIPSTMISSVASEVLSFVKIRIGYIPQRIYGIILSSYTRISTDVSLLISNLYLLFMNTEMEENEQSSLIAVTDRVQHVTEQSAYYRDTPQIELRSADQRQINN